MGGREMAVECQVSRLEDALKYVCSARKWMGAVVGARLGKRASVSGE